MRHEATRQALISKRSTSEDLVSERNRAAMMKANAAGWECLLQIHIAIVFPAAVPNSTGWNCLRGGKQ